VNARLVDGDDASEAFDDRFFLRLDDVVTRQARDQQRHDNGNDE
jgi:hypothetical protein